MTVKEGKQENSPGTFWKSAREKKDPADYPFHNSSVPQQIAEASPWLWPSLNVSKANGTDQQEARTGGDREPKRLLARHNRMCKVRTSWRRNAQTPVRRSGGEGLASPSPAGGGGAMPPGALEKEARSPRGRAIHSLRRPRKPGPRSKTC